jgi:hypothetical protein
MRVTDTAFAELDQRISQASDPCQENSRVFAQLCKENGWSVASLIEVLGCDCAYGAHGFFNAPELE